MVSALDSGASVPGLNPGRGHFVGQDTLLSRCLSPLRCINETGISSGLVGHNWLACKLNLTLPLPS